MRNKMIMIACGVVAALGVGAGIVGLVMNNQPDEPKDPTKIEQELPPDTSIDIPVIIPPIEQEENKDDPSVIEKAEIFIDVNVTDSTPKEEAGSITEIIIMPGFKGVDE